MAIPTIYARREPTKESIVARHISVDEQRRDPNTWSDVVFYAEPEAKTDLGRIPCGQSQPDRRNKWQMLNCYRYRLEWLDNLPPLGG